jgi:O26-antigen biosynthesis N-acetyl-L-fucosamine transferase
VVNICLIIDDYLPRSIKIGAKMMHDLAVELRSQGHSITVITPEPTLESRHQIETLDGVTICRFRTGDIKNTSKLKRAINESLLSLRAWHAFKNYYQENPQDLIVYYSPTIFWGVLVNKLKKLWGAKSYLILRDLFPQWVIDNGMLKERSPIARYFRFFERLNYNAADRIALQSPRNMDIFQRMSSVRKPLDLLYNWAPDVQEEGGGDYKRKLGLEEKVVFFYGGNIGHAQDMMNIVRLAYAMRNEVRAQFVLVGDGDEVSLVREAIAQHKAGNMTLLASVSQDEYKKMLKSFDIGLFSLHRDHTAHNFPGKLLGYMSEKHPILGSVNPGNDLKEIVEEAGAGFISVNGDDAELLANAQKLLNDELRVVVGENAKRLLSSKFSVRAAARTVLSSAQSISVGK